MRPRKYASEDDRRALGAISIWNGDLESAEFHLFMTLAYQSAGRGGEVSSVKFEKFHTIQVKEQCREYAAMELELFRPKTSQIDMYSMYPDRNSIIFDIYFAMGYFLILSQHSSPYLLPNFAENLRIKDNGRIDSTKVSTYFTTAIQKIYKVAGRYIDDYDESNLRSHDDQYSLTSLNPNLTSHCARKGTMNIMSESSVPFYNWVYRVGLMMRNLATIFDYLGPSKNKDRANGKVLSGWTTSFFHNNEFDGGIPPDINTLKDNDLAKKAAEHLFSHHIANGLKKEVAYLIFSSIVMNYDKFMTIVNDEPNEKYKLQEHTFSLLWKRFMNEYGILQGTMDIWKATLQHTYFENNSIGLPLNMIPSDLVGELQIDCRTFSQKLDALLEMNIQMRGAFSKVSTENVQLLRQNRNQEIIIQTLLAKMNNIENQQAHGHLLMEKILQVLSEQGPIQNSPSLTNHPIAAIAVASDNQITAKSTSITGDDSKSGYLWNHHVSIFQNKKTAWADKYVFFFSSDLEAIYKKRLDKGDDYQRQVFFQIKSVMRIMVKLLETSPTIRPLIMDREELAKWKRSIREEGKRCDILMMEKINWKNKKCSPGMHTILKAVKSLSLPPLPLGCPDILKDENTEPRINKRKTRGDG